MYKNICSLAFLIMCFLSINLSSANNVYASSKIKPSENYQGFVVHVPCGATANVVLANEINSKNAVIGQSIEAILTKDFIYKDKIIASEGSVVNGSIVQFKKPMNNNEIPELQIKFTTIRTPYNNIIPISATILNGDDSDVLKSLKDIKIPANSKLTLYFDQPITLGAQ